MFLPRRHRKADGKGRTRLRRLLIGRVREPEFEPVLQLLRFQLDRSLQMTHGLGGRGGRQPPVEHLHKNSRRRAQTGNLVMPPSEQVMGPRVGGVQSERPFRVFADEPRVLHLFPCATVEREFPVAHGHGQYVLRVGRIECDRATRVVEGSEDRRSFFGVGFQIHNPVRVLAGDLAQNKRIAGAGLLDGEKQFQRPTHIKFRLGRESGPDEIVRLRRADASQTKPDGDKEPWKPGNAGHLEVIWASHRLGCTLAVPSSQTSDALVWYTHPMRKRPTIPRLDGGQQTVLLVEDVERSSEFYGRKLRLEPRDGDPGRYAEFNTGESILVLVRRDGSIAPMLPPNATEVALTFTIDHDGFAAWKKWFATCAVEIERETKWIHGGRSLYVRDPDGRRLEFKTPPAVEVPKPTVITAKK